jgi:hypothetical protein
MTEQLPSTQVAHPPHHLRLAAGQTEVVGRKGKGATYCSHSVSAPSARGRRWRNDRLHTECNFRCGSGIVVINAMHVIKMACKRTSHQPCSSAPLFTQCLNSVRSWFLDFSPVGRHMSAGVREPPDLGPPHSLKPGGRHISLVHHLSSSDWYPSAIEAFASSALCLAHPG